jgi:lysophospholipase L1-like esterase
MEKIGMLVSSLLIASFVFGADEYWVKAMTDVHKKFNGKKGSVATYGDSITYNEEFWTPIREDVTNIGDVSNLKELTGYITNESWDLKGEENGNKSGWNVRDGLPVLDDCLKLHNPEVAIIMFGTNDVEDGVSAPVVKKYESDLNEFVKKCLANGTIAVLTTIPPRRKMPRQIKKYNEIIKKIADVNKIPLIDYYEGMVSRRPSDWDGTLISKKDGYHPTKEGNDWSSEGLKKSGYGLRNYLTIKKYAEVYQNILKAK